MQKLFLRIPDPFQRKHLSANKKTHEKKRVIKTVLYPMILISKFKHNFWCNKAKKVICIGLRLIVVNNSERSFYS